MWKKRRCVRTRVSMLSMAIVTMEALILSIVFATAERTVPIVMKEQHWNVNQGVPLVALPVVLQVDLVLVVRVAQVVASLTIVIGHLMLIFFFIQ